jgi:hypothetical protein
MNADEIVDMNYDSGGMLIAYLFVSFIVQHQV